MSKRPWSRSTTRPPVDAFREKVLYLGNGCQVWIAAKGRDGYGRFWIPAESRAVQAHRFSYELVRGPIPDGLQLDHLCRNRACVAPDHLEIVTQHENIMRGTSPSARHAVKTHCHRGHEFSPENTYTRPGGQRLCRACRIVRGEV